MARKYSPLALVREVLHQELQGVNASLWSYWKFVELRHRTHPAHNFFCVPSATIFESGRSIVGTMIKLVNADDRRCHCTTSCAFTTLQHWQASTAVFALKGAPNGNLRKLVRALLTARPAWRLDSRGTAAGLVLCPAWLRPTARHAWRLDSAGTAAGPVLCPAWLRPTARHAWRLDSAGTKQAAGPVLCPASSTIPQPRC